MSPVYVVITPVRDEAKYFQKTIDSLTTQTILPALWIIADDGSTDATGQLADAAASQYSWIKVIHRPNRGFRKSGSGVIDAFYEGFHSLGKIQWDFLIKLDGDLSFGPDYFAKCFSAFAQNPHLGIGGGCIYISKNHALVVDSPGDPKFHVRGATKIYRRDCWTAINGLSRVPGWDTIDEMKANMNGWITYTFMEIHAIHEKETGSAEGVWKDWVKNGLANYYTGYHPIFMLLKCIKRASQEPYLLASTGLCVGFLKGYFQNRSLERDPELLRYVRHQQLLKLTFRKSLWII